MTIRKSSAIRSEGRRSRLRVHEAAKRPSRRCRSPRRQNCRSAVLFYPGRVRNCLRRNVRFIAGNFACHGQRWRRIFLPPRSNRIPRTRPVSLADLPASSPLILSLPNFSEPVLAALLLTSLTRHYPRWSNISCGSISTTPRRTSPSNLPPTISRIAQLRPLLPVRAIRGNGL